MVECWELREFLEECGDVVAGNGWYRNDENEENKECWRGVELHCEVSRERKCVWEREREGMEIWKWKWRVKTDEEDGGEEDTKSG